MSTARIELVLHQALHRCLDERVEELDRRATERVVRVLGRLGVPGSPTVEVRAAGAEDERAVRLLVNGIEGPFPPAFLARLWYAVAPADLREAAFVPPSQSRRGVHDWLIVLAEALDTEEGRDTLAALVERLVPGVVSLHPAPLLSQDDARAIFAGGEVPALADATVILQTLLELGVSLEDREHVARVVRASMSLAGSREDAFEEAFGTLCADKMELQLDDSTFDSLVPSNRGRSRATLDDVDDTVRAAMEVVREHRLRKLGADLPVEFVRTRKSRRSEMGIVVNDRRSPPVPLPGPDEVAVSSPPYALAPAGLTGRRLIDPLTGSSLTAVPAELASEVERAGFAPVSPGAYLVAAYARGVTPLAYRTISIDNVERLLAHFEPESPMLVQAVLDRFSLMTLTRLMRELVREGVPLDDLWRILNTLLRYRELADGTADLEQTLEYVRRELCDRIVVEACELEAIGTGVAEVHETAPEFEQRIEAWADEPPSEDGLRAARSAVWNSVAASALGAQPVLLTSAAARRPLRAAVEYEIPDVQVLARTEIVAGLEVERIGTIGG